MQLLKKTRQIVGLDAIRFLAALLVLLFHFAFWDYPKPGDLPTSTYTPFLSLVPLTWVGWVGVEIFFVLSGFVITYSAQGTQAGTFFRHRFTRLVPAAVICTAITTIAVISQNHHTSAARIAVLGLRDVLFLPIGPYLDNSYWTLSIEIAFYLILFLLLLRKRLSALPLVIGILGLLSTAFWVFASLAINFHSASFSAYFKRYALDPIMWGVATNLWGVANNLLLVHHGCYFAIGVYLWLCLFRPIESRRIVVLLVCIVGGVLQIIFRANAVSTAAHHAFPALFPVTLWLLALGLIVASVRWNENLIEIVGARGVVVLRRVGLMTYPLYLIHQRIGVGLLAHLRVHLPDNPALVLTIIVVCVAAYIISVYGEPPVQRWLRRRLNRQTRAA